MLDGLSPTAEVDMGSMFDSALSAEVKKEITHADAASEGSTYGGVADAATMEDVEDVDEAADDCDDVGVVSIIACQRQGFDSWFWFGGIGSPLGLPPRSLISGTPLFSKLIWLGVTFVQTPYVSVVIN